MPLGHATGNARDDVKEFFRSPGQSEEWGEANGKGIEELGGEAGGGTQLIYIIVLILTIIFLKAIGVFFD